MLIGHNFTHKRNTFTVALRNIKLQIAGHLKVNKPGVNKYSLTSVKHFKGVLFSQLLLSKCVQIPDMRKLEKCIALDDLDRYSRSPRSK